MTGKQSELINQIKSESSHGTTTADIDCEGIDRVAKSKFHKGQRDIGAVLLERSGHNFLYIFYYRGLVSCIGEFYLKRFTILY